MMGPNNTVKGGNWLLVDSPHPPTSFLYIPLGSNLGSDPTCQYTSVLNVFLYRRPTGCFGINRADVTYLMLLLMTYNPSKSSHKVTPVASTMLTSQQLVCVLHHK